MSTAAQMAALRASPPKAIEEVDAWLANYMRCIDEARAEALAREMLHDAASEMLAALKAAEQALRHAGSTLHADRCAEVIAKAEGGAS